MISELIRAILSSFFCTMGFCILLQAPKRAILPSSLVGAISYLLYWVLMQLGMSDAYAIFLGAMIGSFSAQILARRLQMVATIYILLAIVPTVPGLGLYRFMAQLGQGLYGNAAETGVGAMISILGIALGVACGSLLFRTVIRLHRRIHHDGPA